MQTYKGKVVAIIGLSIEGIDSTKYFHAQGASVWCLDRRTKSELGDTYNKLKPLAKGFQIGETYLSDLNRFDLVIRTPGMNPRLPELIAYKKTGKVVSSATKIFFKECPCPIIGVTGTKGKGTTSTLIARMLERAGKKVWLGGNVGVPLLSHVPDIKKSDIVVLELSSFQLEDLTQSPQIAVVLRTTQEHLANQDKLATNFHPTRDEYVASKKSIVRYQTNSDIAILNGDDPTSASFAKDTKAIVKYFSRQLVDADAHVENHTVLVGSKKIASLGEIKLLGEHNLDNIAAASLAANQAGASLDEIRKTALTFEGLEHRLEVVKTIKGVLYINDSFSTVPETAIAAITSFSKPIVLIAGGSEKGSDYKEMGEVIGNSSVKALIAIGAMTKRIVDAAKKGGFKGEVVTGLKAMSDIVKKASALASDGDVVLLSPACASFDMFNNYKERGKLFKHEVSLLQD